MPEENTDDKKPQARPEKAPKKPAAPARSDIAGKSGIDREQRLAEALRANLRRRKSGANETDKKEE